MAASSDTMECAGLGSVIAIYLVFGDCMEWVWGDRVSRAAGKRDPKERMYGVIYRLIDGNI